jgi:hypothetical protein
MPGTFLDRAGRPHSLRDPEEVMLYDGERIPIMSNLTQVLKDYTKAMMVASPADAVVWSAEYFGGLANRGRQDRALPSHAAGGSKLALSASAAYRNLPVDMQERIEEIFSAFDADESGTINRSEFFDMIKQVRALHPGCLRHRLPLLTRALRAPPRAHPPLRRSARSSALRPRKRTRTSCSGLSTQMGTISSRGRSSARRL